MTVSWAEKYRPKGLQDVLGNPQAVATLKAWAESWQKGAPAKKAVLLHGPPGAGKTSAAHALARDMGWGLIELNASDVRSGPEIRRIAGEGSRHETFSETGEYLTVREGKRKLIVLDEADNLYERGGEGATVGEESFSDRGGRRAILETVAAAQQPIVLIANDVYALTKGASSTFQKHVLDVPFRHIALPTLQKMLKLVALAEHVHVDESTLHDVAGQAHGDARSALNDLQALAEGRPRIEAGAAAPLGERNRPDTMYNALATILKGDSGEAARRIVQNVDEPPDFVLAWLDENVPREYKDPLDLATAYEWLSRADVFLGRVQRRQQYGLWATATDLLSYGVTSAKRQPYGTPPYYQFPGWIRKMGSSKGGRATRKSLATKVAAHLRMGTRSVRAEMLPFLRHMANRDAGFAEAAALRFELDEDELRELLGDDAKDAYVEQVLDHVAKRRERPPAQKDVEDEVPEPEPTRPAKGAGGRSLMDF